MSSYAQYLMPLIALQAISFAAISGAFRSASDAVEGINRRFRALPISRVTPLASRMTASMYRCTVALVISLICGHVIGFRFYAGLLYTVAFCGLVLAIGLTLSFLGEVVGTASRNPDATTHLMMLPQLIFGLLSVGVQPASAFPHWIQASCAINRSHSSSTRCGHWPVTGCPARPAPSPGRPSGHRWPGSLRCWWS